jgi:Spy/CpxP family protein refolding chaperone
MKSKIVFLGLAMSAVINISALVTFAYHRWLRHQERPAAAAPGGLNAPFESQLSLSGYQKACLKDLLASFDSETKTILAQIQLKKKALVEEMKKEAPDTASLDGLIEEISRLQASIQKKAVLNIYKEKKILTPEQKERYLRMFEDHICPKECRQGSKSDLSPDCPDFR